MMVDTIADHGLEVFVNGEYLKEAGAFVEAIAIALRTCACLF